MFINHLSTLVTMMAACDERCSYDLDFPWPLHVALARFAAESIGEAWPWSYDTGLVDHAGVGVPALGGAILEALGEGWLQLDPERGRRLVVTGAGAVVARRHMMTLEPRVATWVYRAALLWATNSSILSKNLDMALWSDAAMRSESPPNRLQPVPVSQ